MEKIASYNNLEIFCNEEHIEIRYFDARIYDSLNRRANLFHVFYSQLFVGGQVFYPLFNHMKHVTDDIITGLDTLSKTPKGDANLQTMHMNIIFGLYCLFSTIQDSLFGIASVIPESDQTVSAVSLDTEIIPNKIIEIRKEHRKKIREVERKYLDKLKYDEEVAVIEELIRLKCPCPSPSDFDSFQLLRELEFNLEYGFQVDYLFPIFEALLDNLATIAQIMNDDDYFIEIVKKNTPSLANLLVAKIQSYFPFFIKHYNILRNKDYIEEKTNRLFWKLSKASLADYFGEQYLSYKENESQKGTRGTNWEVLEQVFDVSDLYGAYKKSRGMSGGYKEISSALKEKGPSHPFGDYLKNDSSSLS